MNNILIVEDEQRVADILRRGLEEMGYQITLAYDGEMALRLFKAGRYDIVISDVVLPKISGFSLLKEIKQLNRHIPILMVTALGTTDDKLEGFDAGADDYMVKPFDLRELGARIKLLLKRYKQVEGEAASHHYTYADLKIDLQRMSVYRSDQLIKLTPKEFNLLLYMVKNSERVLSRMEIAQHVWNTYFDTGTNFIDVYINYLRKKIDRNFGQKLIHTKPGMGFILCLDYENNS